MLIFAVQSFVDVMRVFVDSVGVVWLAVVAPLLLTVKVHHYLLVTEVTDHSLDLIVFSMISSAKHKVPLELLGLLLGDCPHILQINRVHVHETIQYKNAVASVLINTEPVDDQHDHDNDNKYQWEHQEHLVAPDLVEKVHHAADVLNCDVNQTYCENQERNDLECHNCPWLNLIPRYDGHITESMEGCHELKHKEWNIKQDKIDYFPSVNGIFELFPTFVQYPINKNHPKGHKKRQKVDNESYWHESPSLQKNHYVNPLGANIVAAYSGSLNMTVKIDRNMIAFIYKVFRL